MTWFIAPLIFHSPLLYILTDKRYYDLSTIIKWRCFDRWVNLHFLDFCLNFPVCDIANWLYWLCICHHQWFLCVKIRTKAYLICLDSQTSNNYMRTNKLIKLEYSIGVSLIAYVNYLFFNTTTPNMEWMLGHRMNGYSFS